MVATPTGSAVAGFHKAEVFRFVAGCMLSNRRGGTGGVKSGGKSISDANPSSSLLLVVVVAFRSSFNSASLTAVC